jgi:hypothetical protein
MNSKIILAIKTGINGVLLAVISCGLPASCEYLDVVPDDIPTVDHAFSNRTTAENYLYGCYSFRPPVGHINAATEADPGLTAGDETWQRYLIAEGTEENSTWPGSRIARGEQNAVSPILDIWHHTYAGIRQCNIFLEKIGDVQDVETAERRRWIAEAKFLKAYYHYVLFKRYGPIPIVDVNLPIDASVEEVQVYREPVDNVVEYIAALLDEALPNLPLPYEVQSTQLGRADQLVALTLKAELRLFAASDLFNGNIEMASMVDNRGVALFPQTYSADKWRIAAEACSLAIEACHAAGKALYKQVDATTTAESPVFQLQSVLRQTIGDRWNSELIWGDTEYDHGRLARVAGTRLLRLEGGTMRWLSGEWAPTLKAVEQYYSSRGVPVKYDREWVNNGWYDNRYKIRPEVSTGNEKYLVEEGQRTVYLHFNREPRFYAWVAFDKGVYFGAGRYKFETDRNVLYADYLNLKPAGYQAGVSYSTTGYSVKKFYGMHAVQETNSVNAGVFFPFPIFRLADLYLMYAEALNEAEGPTNADIFYYIDMVRDRAGLDGLKYSWDTYTDYPGYYNDKDNLREIIRQERAIELAFEGKRFWDLRRWRKITEFNEPPLGWYVEGETPEDFYNVTNLPKIPLRFTIKDYFWPIKESNLYVNRNLKQNYGW